MNRSKKRSPTQKYRRAIDYTRKDISSAIETKKKHQREPATEVVRRVGGLVVNGTESTISEYFMRLEYFAGRNPDIKLFTKNQVRQACQNNGYSVFDINGILDEIMQSDNNFKDSISEVNVDRFAIRGARPEASGYRWVNAIVDRKSGAKLQEQASILREAVGLTAVAGTWEYDFPIYRTTNQLDAERIRKECSIHLEKIGSFVLEPARIIRSQI